MLAYSAVLGAVLVLVADSLGRLLARPGEVQAGIVMAFVGVPIFISVVRRRQDRRAVTAIRTGPVSLRVRGRAIVAATARRWRSSPRALAVVAIGTGEFPLSPTAVVDTLLGGGPPGAEFIVNELRLPRVVAALVCGAALGISGAIFQAITRNPLGSPDVVGFQAGCVTGALFVITVLGGGGLQASAGAVVGGLATAAIVYGLAFKGRRLSSFRLVLVGIAIAALMLALTDFMLSRARIEEAQEATRWLLG